MFFPSSALPAPGFPQFTPDAFSTDDSAALQQVINTWLGNRFGFSPLFLPDAAAFFFIFAGHSLFFPESFLTFLYYTISQLAVVFCFEDPSVEPFRPFCQTSGQMEQGLGPMTADVSSRSRPQQFPFFARPFRPGLPFLFIDLPSSRVF